MKVSNESGILPVEYKVLIKMDPREETTKGGIVIPTKISEREEQAQVYATLIDVGGQAFSDWDGRVPKPGDRVMIAKYAGLIADGADGERYRIVQDKDISAIIFMEVSDD